MKVEEFASSLFELEVNMHIAHLQTSSFAAHMALNTLYQDIVEMRDSFIESYQGKYGIITKYKSFNIAEGIDPLTYLKSKITVYTDYRSTLSDGYLQQIIDDIITLITSTTYKLKFLN